MIVVTWHEYDDHRVEGIFPSMEEAYKHFRHAGMKPQLYDWEKQVSFTDFEYIADVERWCGWQSCNTVVTQSKPFCVVHLPMENERRDKQKHILYMATKEWEENAPQRQAEEEERLREFWKNVAMSGSSASPILGKDWITDV